MMRLRSSVASFPREQRSSIFTMSFVSPPHSFPSPRSVPKRPQKKSHRYVCSVSPAPATNNIIAHTHRWVTDVVIALNLCPFARDSLSSARIHVSPSKHTNDILDDLFREIDHLSTTTAEQVSTTLVVMPALYPDSFPKFHQFAEELEMAMEDGADGKGVMMVAFHPLHEWAGCNGQPVNFDRRAPYPIINLLRTEEVDAVVGEGLADGMLQKNERTLNECGWDEMHQLYERIKHE